MMYLSPGQLTMPGGLGASIDSNMSQAVPRLFKNSYPKIAMQTRWQLATDERADGVPRSAERSAGAPTALALHSEHGQSSHREERDPGRSCTRGMEASGDRTGGSPPPALDMASLVSSLQALVEEALVSANSRLSTRYRSLPSGDHEDMVASGEVTAGVLPENYEKNRYSNICPYDARRVVLRRPCSDGAAGATDYINASHITLPGLRAIASQGPTHPQWHGPDTTGDFWAAIWEQKCEVVVALAKVQPGFSGSARYWPETAAQGLVATGWPALTVRLISEDKGPHFITRRFQLDLSSETDAGTTTREVTHFQYDRWPNYGVPDAPDDVAALLRAVETLESARVDREETTPHATAAELATRPPPPPPLWVHCSGGVGRSGVFLTALSVYRSLCPPVSTAGAAPMQPMATTRVDSEQVGSVPPLFTIYGTDTCTLYIHICIHIKYAPTNVLCGAGGGEDGGVVAATTPPLDGRRYRAVHFHSRGFAAPVRQRSWDRRAKATDAVDVT